MLTDFHAAHALALHEERIARATAIREARAARRHTGPSRLRLAWGRLGHLGRPSPVSVPLRPSQS